MVDECLTVSVFALEDFGPAGMYAVHMPSGFVCIVGVGAAIRWHGVILLLHDSCCGHPCVPRRSIVRWCRINVSGSGKHTCQCTRSAEKQAEACVSLTELYDANWERNGAMQQGRCVDKAVVPCRRAVVNQVMELCDQSRMHMHSLVIEA